jgi:hypothetical protein
MPTRKNFTKKLLSWSRKVTSICCRFVFRMFIRSTRCVSDLTQKLTHFKGDQNIVTWQLLNIKIPKANHVTCLGESAINLLKPKVAQNVVISLGYSVFSKNHNELLKVTKLVKNHPIWSPCSLIFFFFCLKQLN